MSKNIVMLDAVGTTIFPFPPAVDAYAKIASSHHIEISKNRIRRRFFAAWKSQFQLDGGTYELPCSDQTDRKRWNSVVRLIFRQNYSDQLFEDLWNHFAQPEAWNRFDDVSQFIAELQKMGFEVGIASNFDSRLAPIAQSLLPEIPNEMIFYSTDLGFAKPDVRFFKTIERRLKNRFDSLKVMMIGDNWALDVEAAKRSGWNAIWKPGPTLPAISEVQRHFLRST